MNIPQLSGPKLTAPGSPREGRPAPSTATGSAAVAQDAAARQVDAGTVQQAKAQANAEQVRDAVAEMNRAMRLSNRSLEFSVDEESERVVVRLKDSETGELIRQFPSEETLAIARYLADLPNGALLSQKA